MNLCPRPATKFLLSVAGVRDGSCPDVQAGVVLLAFCDEHQYPVVSHVLGVLGFEVSAESVVMEIAALESVVMEFGMRVEPSGVVMSRVGPVCVAI
jgi:hypothetical protein